MKTKVKRMSKRTLALLLGVLMLVTSIGVGSIVTANAANITSDGNAILFFKMNAVSWWNCGTNGNQNFAYFYGTSGSAWSAHSVQQTGNYYYVKVPSGTWDHVILTRNSVTSSPSWDNKYNQTGDIALESGKNYISAFSENKATATFSTYQVDSTASLSASKTSASTGENVTLTPGISTNTTYNAYNSVAYSISPSSGASISGNTFTATSAGTYTVTATVTYNAKGYTGITKTATATKEITVTSSATALSAPTIKYNSATTTPVSMNAAKGSKARITWDAVANAGSYEVYKGSTKVATVNTTYYDIERGYSYGGAYTVKAVPTDTTSYSTSNASNGIEFTFNKVALTAPTVTPDKTTVFNGDKVTFTVSGGATSGTLGTDYRYQRTDANGSTYSNVTGSSWTTGQLDNTTTSDVSDVFKFKTVAISTDYYSSSTSTTSKTITVKPAFGVDSGSSSTFTPGTATAMSYDSAKAAYYLNVTLSSTSDYYFRINQMGAAPMWSGSWNGSYPNVNDVVVDGAKVAADNDVSSWGNKASLHYSGSAKKIIIWFDYANKKVWIEGNSTKYSVTITQPSATGSSIKVADATTSPQQFFDGDTVNYSVTAGTGNVITGVTINGNTTAVDRKTSYTGSFDISQNTTITATVVKQYSITKNTATGGTYTVKRDNTTVTTFIAGDTLTLTPSPDDHYDFTKFTVSGGKSATLTANPSTLDTTGATGNITIDPTWTPKSYSVSATAKYTNSAAANTQYAATDFTQNFTTVPAVTIGANSATNVTGVTVKAPANDPTGYVFVGWFTTNGSFTNASNKDTTFKPNGNNAVALAGYQKIHSITYSVDPSGTGAGTVTTSKTSVEAGGSYSITATPKSGSAIESIKVNNGTGTTTSPRTVSSVSADQTVVVKFKSNVHLRGGSTIGGNWDTGHEMTSNAAGTEFTKTYENVAGSSSGTQYQFKLYVNGYNNDGTATINITGGTSTGTCTHQSSGDQNYVLTLKKAANVTVKSNGTKITEIKVVPANSAKYAVTFKKAANTTITGQYEGTNFSTASADAVVQVYEGDEISFTATADSGKYLSGLTTTTGTLSPAFSAKETYTGKITSVTSAGTVTPTAASKLTVTAKTNKSARGTVSVNNATAYPGQTVTITVTPKNGILSSLVVTNNSTSAVEKKWQRNSSGEIKVQASTKKTKNSLLTAADDPLTFTMPNASVTVNATFDAYSAESTWYYNGYDTSGNALSGYHTKQMTEGMVGGQKFSYYHVEGRSGAHQLMTVSDGAPSSGTRYVYFVRPNNYGYGWSASNNPKAHFWKNGGQDYDTWPGTEMSWQWNNDYGQGVYKIAIPDGADRVSFNDATNNGEHQTLDIDLTTTSGAYYVGEWNSTYSKYEVGTWDTGWADQGWVASGTEYFYQNSDHNGDYTGDFNTKGFYNHYTASKLFAKPKDLGTNTGDYYINVLYPNTTYTINGVTKKTGTNPMIIWSAEPLAGDDETIKIYAKDGSIRAETFGSTYANIADTKIYASDGTTTIGTKQNGSITNQTYETYSAAKGDTIVIKTQIGATDSSNLSNAAALKAKYYVRGFCVNGEVSELLEWNSSGLYTLTYKVPEDYEGKAIEITPIYYLKDTSANPIVTYRVTGFTDELKAVGSGKPGWGDTLYTYPYYGKLGGQNNAFGAYPGQPMVYYKGQYQMQIPQKSTAWDPYQETAATVNNTTVSGITMSNGYWDSVHKQVMGYGDNSTSADHVQTYDYGDFYKIFNEKKPVDNIVFDFKYRTKNHNLTDIITTSTTASALNTKYGDTNGNGFEPLTNFHGRTVDLFGTPLAGDQLNATPVYVVSTGGVIDNKSGVENIAGYYATEWVVYGNTSGTTYQRITGGGKNSIPPEVLVLNDDDDTSFSNTTYPSADATHKLTDWKALYTALEAYRGKPVMISYEAADAQQGQGLYYTGTGGATRNDGRWLYSKTGENITSKIKIQYSDDNGVTYTDLDDENVQNKPTGLSAYFTNDGVEGEMTYSTTIDPDKTFDFEAKTTNANYKFVGWFMEDGTKITTDNSSHTERSGSYTFVAKFMQVQSGQLILSHSADKGTISGTNYQGSGTAKIGVVVKNGDGETVRTYDLTTSDITLDDKVIKSDSTNTIEVTLEATATGYDEYGTTVLATPSGQDSTYFSSKSDSTSGKTKTIVLNSFTVASLFSGTTQNVKNIIYHSYFREAEFNYKLTFAFNDRFGNAKNYIKQGKLTSNQAANTKYVKVINGKTCLLPEFYSTLAPHESNFGKDFEWLMTSNLEFTHSGSVYTCTATISSNQTTGKRTATFNLPYAHTNGVPSSYGVMDKASVTKLVIENIDYGSLVKNEDDNYNFVTAPRQISDDGTTKNFQYWSIASTSNPDKEVSRCYYYKFNFVMYDNYIITPVYENSESVLGSENPLPSISFLQSTRNQYNADSTDTSAVNSKALDYVFNDFVMSFDYNNIEIFKADETSDSITQLGYVVERVQKLEPKQDGTPYTDPTHYSGKNLKTVSEIKTWIDNNKSNTNVVKDGKTLTRFTVNKSDLDNKNRVEFYEAYLNSKEWNSTDQTFARKSADKNYVYKAYTYMIVNGEVYLSDPAYFTMYEEATQK